MLQIKVYKFVISLFFSLFLMDQAMSINLNKGLNNNEQSNSIANFVLTAEKTRYAETGTYAEVESYCQKMASNFPNVVSCQTLGRTSEGRKIQYMVLSKQGIHASKNSIKKKTPVVLIIAGTHAGEVDGKDASLLYFRELITSKKQDNPLNHLTVIWVPVFNVDGHEHRGRFHRPNQNGPYEQGERVNGRRINLARDWMFAQSTEMKGMLGLVKAWDPSVVVDLHVTDGLRYRHDVSISAAPDFGGDYQLTEVARGLLDEVLQNLKQSGHTPLGFYPRLKDKEDPKAGMVLDVDKPRFAHSYAAIRNRIGFLVEDHAWEPYASRTKTCFDTLNSILKTIVLHSNQILQTETFADHEASKLAGRYYALDYETDIDSEVHPKRIELLGYKYQILDPAPIIGGRFVSYDLTQEELWQIPFYDQVAPLKETITTLPRGGYLIPTAWTEVVKPYLDLHGIKYKTLQSTTQHVELHAYHVNPSTVDYDSSSFQGRQRVAMQGEWQPQTGTLQKNSIFVPIDQPKALLAVHLLEPMGPDSLSAWGLFNTAYEINDYMANHRSLEVIRWMYEENPKIKALYGEDLYKKLPQIRKDYEQLLSNDAGFRLDTNARLDFWISRLPPQDPSLNIYPIKRVEKLNQKALVFFSTN